MFIDLHTHTLFSDGDLLPSELVARAARNGYKAIALTDHVDFSNMDFVIRRIKNIVRGLSSYYGIKVLAGCEITYAPPPLIKKAVRQARSLGAQIVVVHGESPAEPAVPQGTNRSAILSGADILAHPGYISYEEVQLAAQKNICLEITTRHGHRDGNKHIARLALKNGKTQLILNTDTHSPEDMIDPSLSKVKHILKLACLPVNYYENVMLKNSQRLLEKIKN